MEFGLAIDFGSRTETLSNRLRSTVPLLELAETLGFTSIWAGEQYPTSDDYFHLPAPLQILAALAPQTGLTLGTGVTLLPAWDPLRLAYEVAVLNEIADGRLILGIGVGTPALAARFGTSPERLGDRLDETLQALRAMWSGNTDFHGELINMAAPIHPRPIRTPGPDIWVGGLVKRSASRAAVFGDGWYGATSYGLAHDITRQADRYRLACIANGQPVGAVSVNRLVALAPTDQAARLECGPYLEPVLDFYADRKVLADRQGVPLTTGQGSLLDFVGDDVAMIGSPSTVNTIIEAYAAAGVTHIQARVRPGDMPMAMVARTIKLLGEEVIRR